MGGGFLPFCCYFCQARCFCRKKQQICYCLCRFSLDFKKGNDIAFHFNPRFNEDNRKVIVCNSMFHNHWGKEERAAPRFPFEAGKPFKVTEMSPTGSQQHLHRALGNLVRAV